MGVKRNLQTDTVNRTTLVVHWSVLLLFLVLIPIQVLCFRFSCTIKVNYSVLLFLLMLEYLSKLAIVNA